MLFRALVCAALCVGGVAAQAATIDFEDYTGTIGPVSSPFASGGFSFVGSGVGVPLVVLVEPPPADNNSLLFCPGCEVVMTESRGSGFALNSLELSSMGDLEVGIIGTYGDGSTVMTTAVGTDLVVVPFDSDWERLTSVRFVGVPIDGRGVVLDNINVDVVPIPAAVWLFASAFGSLVLARRHR